MAASLGLLALLPWATALGLLATARRPGSRVLAGSVAAAMLVQVLGTYAVLRGWSQPLVLPPMLLIEVGGLALPVAVTTYLAREFATTRRQLEAQLAQATAPGHDHGEPGQGTAAAPAAELTPSAPLIASPAAAAEAVAEAHDLDATSVLLIEDNADMREYLRSVLAPAGYHLLEAANGEAGLALAYAQLPDLVLSDAMMPHLDGFGVCRALKLNASTSHIPLVLLTARADLPSRLHGLEFGADAYLTKPFCREELLAQLHNLIRGRQQLQATYRRSLTEPLPQRPPTLDETFLARVRQAVEAALDDETLGVETLSHELALSRAQLHRKLKALTGQAPGDFIRLVRLTRAHELLAAGAATVAEVAYQVGYGNPANFSTSFSRHFGYAPSEARRRVVAKG